MLQKNLNINRPAGYTDVLRGIIGWRDAERVHSILKQCPRYDVTPLHDLASSAYDLNLGHVLVKDERQRLGLGSFKALGGVYALSELVRDALRERHGVAVSFADLLNSDARRLAASLTAVCATDGNHGLSVAAGARLFGCHCTVILHAAVTDEKERLIRGQGADIIRLDGTYDDAVASAQVLARSRNWKLVADTSADGDDSVCRSILHGYAVMAKETIEQAAAVGHNITHVFLQAGVGGFAAAVIGSFWDLMESGRPKFVIVEPEAADCLYQSNIAGRIVRIGGSLDTAMDMLSCGEPSAVAWPIITAGGDFFLRIPDEAAIAAMARFSRAVAPSPASPSTPSGCSGLGGLCVAATEAGLRREIGLNAEASVLIFVTESDKSDLLAKAGSEDCALRRFAAPIARPDVETFAIGRDE